MGKEELFTGRGTETRTFLYFKAPAAALEKLVPEGWRIGPVDSGPAASANLLAIFVDQATSLDADDKPLDPMRYVLFEIPVSSKAAGGTALMLFTGLSTGGAGTYGTNLKATARVERAVRHEPAGSMVAESWEFDAGGGEHVALRLRFRRGPVSVQQTESRVYSQVRPDFSRIYRVEQSVDVVQPSRDPGRLAEVAFEATTAKLAPIFDGAEQLIAIISVPVYARRIYVPA